MGIRDKPISAGSPWQNSFAERLIGTIHRECVDHIVVLGEAHLRRILREYARYYNTARITGHWTRMRRSHARFSGSDASCRMSWLAGCITNMPGFRFSARTGTLLVG
jgi:transposase InsO family protein